MQQFAVVMFFKTMYNIKQLSNLVLVISGIIKDSVSVISLVDLENFITQTSSNIVYNLPPLIFLQLCTAKTAERLHCLCLFLLIISSN